MTLPPLEDAERGKLLELAEEIASKLTYGQKDVIVYCDSNEWRRATRFSGKCATRLMWGLRFPQLITSRGYGCNHKEYKLLPLGEAVKRELLSHD